MKTLSTKGNLENITFRNTRSIKDFIERNDQINIKIANNQKIEKEMDTTHQSILNPYTRRKMVILK